MVAVMETENFIERIYHRRARFGKRRKNEKQKEWSVASQDVPAPSLSGNNSSNALTTATPILS
jgi:hypothetical protein